MPIHDGIHYQVISDTLPLGSTTLSIQLGVLDSQERETATKHYCIVLFNNSEFIKLYSECDVLKSGVLNDIPFSKTIRDWILWHVDMDPYGVEVTLKVLIRFLKRKRKPPTTTQELIQKILAGDKLSKRDSNKEIEINRAQTQ